jgi:hypothetical protein
MGRLGCAYLQIAWMAWIIPEKLDWRRKIETHASSLAGGLLSIGPIRRGLHPIFLLFVLVRVIRGSISSGFRDY